MAGGTGQAIGEIIRFHRGRRGWSQEKLAERAGMAATSIVRLENGEIERPRVGSLNKIAGALEIDPRDLTSFAARGPVVAGSQASGPFTAIYERTDDGWWAVSVPEIPGAVSQGRTLEEAREMIRDATRMLLEVRREDAEREAGETGHEVIREPLAL
jgi:predicted RNase H-like HicB family nuclease/DNA-binding Xre family transcriptional regulator